MKDIFISYSRSDESKVHIISNDLESLGHNVWFDTELYGGENWWGKILENIRSSNVL